MGRKIQLVAIGRPGPYAGETMVSLQKEGYYGGNHLPEEPAFINAVTAAAIRAKWAEQEAAR